MASHRPRIRPPPLPHTHTASASSRQAWRLSPCCRVLLSCCGSCAAALHVGIRSHASWQCTGGVDVCTDIMSHLKYGEHQELSWLHPQSFLDRRFSSSCIRRIIYLPVLLRWTDCHFWAPGKQVLLINKQLESWLQTVASCGLLCELEVIFRKQNTRTHDRSTRHTSRQVSSRMALLFLWLLLARRNVAKPEM